MAWDLSQQLPMGDCRTNFRQSFLEFLSSNTIQCVAVIPNNSRPTPPTCKWRRKGKREREREREREKLKKSLVQMACAYNNSSMFHGQREGQ